MTRSVVVLTAHTLNGSLGSTSRLSAISHQVRDLGYRTVIASPFETTRTVEWADEIICSRNGPISSILGESIYRCARSLYSSPTLTRVIGLSGFAMTRAFRVQNSTARRAASNTPNEMTAIISTDPISSLAAIRMKHDSGVVAIAEFQGIWSEELLALGFITRSSQQYARVRDIERYILHESDYVVLVSNSMRDYVVDSFGHDIRAELIVMENGGPDCFPVDWTKRSGKQVVYAGLLDARQNADLFVESIPIVLKSHPNASFHLTDRGDDRRRIHRLCKTLGVSPDFHWFENRHDLRVFLSSADVAVLPSIDAVPRRIAPPTKLYEYMSLGLPIVANDIGGWSNIIREEGLGKLTDGNPRCFAEGIVELLDSGDRRISGGKAGQNALTSRYAWNITLKPYERILSGI